MQRALEVAGYGRAIPLGTADPSAAVADHVEALLASPAREPLLEDGSAEIVQVIVALARARGQPAGRAAPTR